ncbi:hypothetical protein NBRC116188_22360 [Oceaniserpentilla sp. 4NH20-0058]|uniref:hypothetical protein n=1 Tax=Oceaniserpentilla sp. 4NH20-0058 TaxID=3127660 RepID=UPI003103D90B
MIIMGDEEVIIDENGHTDDEYEVLVKALGAYNQGATKFNNSLSWSEILTDSKTMEDAKLVKAIRYGLDILKDIEKPNGVRTDHGIRLPLRTYIWEGGVYSSFKFNESGELILDENGAPTVHPQAGKKWCFVYGEEHWITGLKYDDVKKQSKAHASGYPKSEDTDYRVGCS